LGFVGSPLSFEAKIKTAKNVQSGSLGAVWSFGDGTQKVGQNIEHIYQFPGEYIVILNAGLGSATAVSKTKVKIVDPNISFSFSPDGYVEISNLSDLELNIGGWIIESENTRFIVPTDTLISKKSSIKIASASTRITTYMDYVRIANPSGKIIATIAAKIRDPIVPGIVLPPGMNESLLKEKLQELTYRR
jgi:PKD repeat protein